MMKMLLEWGLDQEYFPDPAKPLFIVDSSAHEASAWREFETEGLALKFVLGSQ